MENQLINVHPVDELAAIREEMKQLKSREDEIRDMLLKEGADLNGEQYTAGIIPSTRETVDKAALIAELGREAVAKFMKTSLVRTVKLIPKQG